MKKQTAVEWLVEEINKMIDFIPMDKWDEIRDIVQQAKEMEKEQIKDAHLIGLITSMEMEATKQAEQYYNETFIKEL